ncbi:hypothetical protein [Rhodococcus sp. 14-2470-1a]|uniref:hypothetical protein n=1 Tax=Rhodococcus sp. 14-2470-1a TaxID=2023150 RepID=UPI00117B99E3|nr:hypothetical protein [Rhodococcus sp. 14-2470-1a]
MFESESHWVDRVFDILYFANAKLRMPSLPLTGTSTLLSKLTEAIRTDLGEEFEIVQFDGRMITEKNQTEYVQDAVTRAETLVDTQGSCIMLLDHYSHAMKRSRAPRMQTQLFNLLINSHTSAKVGCLISHRTTQLSNLNLQASSFLSRFRYQPAPLVNELDSFDNGHRGQVQLASERVGRVPLFVRASSPDGTFDAQAWDYFWQDASREIARDLPEDAIKFILNPESENLERTPILNQFTALGSEHPNQLLLDRLRVHLLGALGAWPTAMDQSASRFGRMLDSQGPSYWYDTYIYSPDIRDRVVEFLRELRKWTDVDLRIMGANLRDWSTEVTAETLKCFGSIPNVEARIVPWRESSTLHDRHLVAVGSTEGYNIPEIRDVAVVKRRGSATESKFWRSPVDYSSLWRGAAAAYS